MNRMKSLEKRLEELNNENTNLDIRLENLTKRKKNECKLILEKYFGRSYGDYNCDINSERVSVKYKDMRYSIVDLYFYTSWKGDNMSYDKIELSMPSFRPDNVAAWVVDRFQMLTSITSIVVTNENDNTLPSLQLKWDWNINSVSGIRATKMSASGKSVDLEVRTRFRDYNSSEFQFRTTEVEKVRFDNVESFLRRNEKMIG